MLNNGSTKSTKIKHRLTPVSISTMSISHRFQPQLGHSDLYSQIVKNRKR